MSNVIYIRRYLYFFKHNLFGEICLLQYISMCIFCCIWKLAHCSNAISLLAIQIFRLSYCFALNPNISKTTVTSLKEIYLGVGRGKALRRFEFIIRCKCYTKWYGHDLNWVIKRIRKQLIGVFSFNHSR